MKMAKKLLAVVLTGVMAVSMLTGCATLDARNIASDLEGMLKVVNDKATVSATNDAKDLAAKAAKAVQADTTEWVAPTENEEETSKVSMEEAVKAKLETEKITDKYVWYTCYKSEDVKNVAQAQEICDLLVSGKAINTVCEVHAIDSSDHGKKQNRNRKPSKVQIMSAPERNAHSQGYIGIFQQIEGENTGYNHLKQELLPGKKSI